MDVLLDLEQVDERLVDDGMGPVPLVVEQPAKRVLHRAGDGREDMGLDGWELNDVFVEEELRHLDAFGEDLVEHQERFLRGVWHPWVFRLEQVRVLDLVLVGYVLVLVVALPDERIDHDSAVVCTDEVVIAVLLECPDHALELPGRRRTGGIPRLPRDVDLQHGILVGGQRVLIASQAHHLTDIFQHRIRFGFEDGDLALAGEVLGDHGWECSCMMMLMQMAQGISPMGPQRDTSSSQL